MADIFDIFRSLEKKQSERQGPPTVIVAGLGNPGAKYVTTRHNTGFAAIDHIAAERGAKVIRSSHRALCGECEIEGVRVLLMKPQTYMNNSGEAISAAAKYYKIPPERVIVISDDVTLDPGRIRVRKKGSAGGHNGLKSIIEHLSTDEFPRVRVGVGKLPSPGPDMADFVLGQPCMADRDAIEAAFPRVLEAVSLLCLGKTDEAMSRCNGK